MNLLYNENTLIGRLKIYFSCYFESYTAPTAETMFLFILAILALESAKSIRFLYRHFLAGITVKSLNAFYYMCSYSKVDYNRFMNITARTALKLIPKTLETQPVFLCIDDTMVPKFGRKFENVSTMFDHANHNGSNYLNGHCFVSVMLCIPVWNKRKPRHRISYLAIPLGYCMWQKEKTKLELAASMVRQVMPEFQKKKDVIILCDSWYVKSTMTVLVDEYENLNLIGNARIDTAIYDLPPVSTGKRGRPPKRGRRLSIMEDFPLSTEKMGGYYIGVRTVLTNLFGDRKVLAYVTSAEKDSQTRRLFFSTIFPMELQIFCAWQEKEPLNQTGNNWMQYIPMFLYSFRWSIEVSYYEQKQFWSLCSYMVRSRKGIEMLVNLINIAYCAMKLLPYQDETFSKYQNESTQEIRFALSERIRQEVFFANLVENTERGKKSIGIIDSAKQWFQKQCVQI